MPALKTGFACGFVWMVTACGNGADPVGGAGSAGNVGTSGSSSAGTSGAAGSVTNSAILTVIVTPIITPQPTDQTVNVGSTAVFTSGATGVPTPGLQWYKGNTALLGETGNTLTIANAQGNNIALYKLVASNTAGSVTSSVVKLTVNSTALTSTTLAPANGAAGVRYDTPLYVTFNAPISIVNSGKIRIYNATNQITPVDTIDMSSNVVVVSGGINLTNNIQPHSLFSGDAQVINYFPVIITGNTGIDDVNSRMIPRSNGAGGTDVEGKSSEGASGGGGIPGGSAPHDDARK